MNFRASVSISILLIMVIRVSGVAVQSSGPYTDGKVSQSTVNNALKKAQSQKKILMVEFGANWCVDCVVLARTLDESPTKKYFQQHFVVLRVDVGKFDHNLDLMKALGVELNAIPTAVFFDQD